MQTVSTRELAATFITYFSECVPKAKEHGMRVGCHAHGGDFAKADGAETSRDLSFGNTKPEVVMQLDIGNCIGGGGDRMVHCRAGRLRQPSTGMCR